MPRHQRLQFRGAIHHVVVRGSGQREIFLRAIDIQGSPGRVRQLSPNAVAFERLVCEVCAETGAVLHAYCIAPDECRLLIGQQHMALAAVMRRLCGRYSRHLRAGNDRAEASIFASRYRSKVIAPAYLGYAMRRVHRSVLGPNLWQLDIAYPFSSDGAYRGRSSPVRIEPSPVLNALQRAHPAGPEGYRRFMAADESPHVAQLLDHGSPIDCRVVGERGFVERSLLLAAQTQRTSTRDQLFDAVGRLLGVAPETLYSRSPAAGLGRALIAWYGLRSATATLREMGSWFSVSAAAMGQGIDRQRARHPELFNLDDLISRAD